MKGLELKKLRKKQKLNQADFGKLLGVSRNTIINWEADEELNDRANRLVADYLANISANIEGNYNQVGNENTQNFLGESEGAHQTNKEAEQAEEIKRLTQELLDCKSRIIDLLSKNA